MRVVRVVTNVCYRGEGSGTSGPHPGLAADKAPWRESSEQWPRRRSIGGEIESGREIYRRVGKSTAEPTLSEIRRPTVIARAS